MLNNSKWDKLAIHASPVQRQVHRQNSTFSERSTGQELPTKLGRLLEGSSWLGKGQKRRSALGQP
jgi:hypothetical protein